MLKGAELAFDFLVAGETTTSTSYWVKGDKFVLCDALDGSTTVPPARCR